MIVFFSYNISNKTMEGFCDDQVHAEFLGYPVPRLSCKAPLGIASILSQSETKPWPASPFCSWSSLSKSSFPDAYFLLLN